LGLFLEKPELSARRGGESVKIAFLPEGTGGQGGRCQGQTYLWAVVVKSGGDFDFLKFWRESREGSKVDPGGIGVTQGKSRLLVS